MPFDVWLEQTPLASNTQRDYYRAIEGRISDWARDGGLIDGNLLDMTDPETFESLRSQIEGMTVFRTRNAKENNRFSAALRHFSKFVSSVPLDPDSLEIDSIRERTDIPATAKFALINARIGQGKFRHDLLEKWGSCAVLGTRDRFLLVASHIKPWAKSTDQERLDPYNGLLLTSHLDRSFDQGRISFREDGRMIISPTFRDAEKLGISEEMAISPDQRHIPYLEFHRKSVFVAA